jgi:hypothetical protein
MFHPRYIPKKNENRGWRCSLRHRAPALQAQSPKLKPQLQKKKKKKKKKMLPNTDVGLGDLIWAPVKSGPKGQEGL